MINKFKKITRFDVLTFFILMSILIIIFRSFDLQHTKKEKYSNLISKFEIKEYIIKTSRGPIVDRNNVVLAESILLESLIVTKICQKLHRHETKSLISALFILI